MARVGPILFWLAVILSAVYVSAQQQQPIPQERILAELGGCQVRLSVSQEMIQALTLENERLKGELAKVKPEAK